MSPKTRLRKDGSVRPSRYRAVQPWPIAWLTLAWITLWGEARPSLMLLVGGVLVAVIMSITFPLPALETDSRIRPLKLIALIIRFIRDIIWASIHVSWVVLRRRPLKNAVVTVDLVSTSDFVLTGVAAMLSLVPGSVVVEARRSTHTIFLHVLDVPDVEAAEQFRQEALAVEQRFLAAFEPKELPPAKEVSP